MKNLFPHHFKDTPLAFRITSFVSNWSKLTNDKEILQIVKSLKIQFLERPSQKEPPAERKMSLEEEKLVGTEVQELLRKGAITPAQVSEDQFVSNIFLRPKRDNRFHLIINLKKLNQLIPYSHFKMEGLKQLKDLLRQNNLIIKIDLKDAYFSIPLHPETQKYVRFQWKWNLHHFLYLCFGLRPAPRIFTKLKKSCINSMQYKHLIDNLPWPYSNYGEKSGGNLNESRHSNISTTTPRFCNKSTEIQIGSKHKTRILGVGDQFGGHDNVPPKGENNGHNPSVQETLLRGKYNPEGINKSYWKIDFNISSSPLGSSTFSLITNVSDNKAEGQTLLQRQK